MVVPGPSSGTPEYASGVDVISGLTLAAPAGLNAYIPLLVVAIAQRAGWIQLREPYDTLGSWGLIGLIAALLVVEVVADKVPAVDHVNDVVQTVVRPAAGGFLALASGHGTVSPAVLVVAGVLIAGGVHSVKATARPVINVSTAGAGAPVASTAEDAGALGITVLALVVPVLAAALVIAAVVLALLYVRRRRRRRRPAG